MRIVDMIGLLENAREIYGDDVQVCIAMQENYPISADVHGIWAQYSGMTAGRVEGVVWITSTNEGCGYAPEEAWDMSVVDASL